MIQGIHKVLYDKKGFTLIELMIVVAIIGILAAVAIPNFLGMRKKAYNSAAQSEASNARLAQESYYTDYDTYATSVAGMQLVQQGLATTPNVTFSASGGSSSYTVTAYHASGNKTYTATPTGLTSN